MLLKRIDRWLEVAKAYASFSRCSRAQLAALYVSQDGVLLSVGYNGTIRGAKNCGTDIPCLKDKMNEPTRVSYNFCPAVHAELNGIINAAREGTSLLGSSLVINATKTMDCSPCLYCKRAIFQAGVYEVVWTDDKGRTKEEKTSEWVKQENDWMTSILKRGVPPLEEGINPSKPISLVIEYV